MHDLHHSTDLERRQTDMLASIHALTDRLPPDRQGEFGKAVLFTGAAIVAQAHGPEELRAMLRAMGWTAKAAYAEGRAEA